MIFRWNDWNVEHVAKHGVSPEEAEWVVEQARRPYPEAREDGKRFVIGRGHGGWWLQVVYIYDPEEVVYVIHARPLRDHESVEHAGDSDEESRKIINKARQGS